GTDSGGGKSSVGVLAPESLDGFVRGALAVKSLVLDNEGRPIDGGKQISIKGVSVVPMMNGHDARTRDSQKMFLQRLAVSWPVSPPAAHGRADDYGNGHLPV